MHYEVVLSLPATRDLEQIMAYIAMRLYNKTAASDFLDKFDEQIDGLRHNPRLYGLSKNRRLAGKEYRKMPIVGTNYLAVYKVDDVERKVKILRVFYMRRNYEDLL